MRCYNEKVQVQTVSTQYRLDPHCNGYLVLNNGDCPVFVNGFPLKPPVAPNLSGESTGVLGNQDEIFIGSNGVITITFVAIAGSVNPMVVIKEKYYVDK